MNTNYIKFWGVRGSRPTAEKNKMEYGGDTSCVEIRTKSNEMIILDMGTGLSNLGNDILKDNNSPKTINIFLSHYHWDHLLGFLNFTPLFDKSFTFNIYGNNKSTSINDISNKLLDNTFWPVSIDMLKANINFKSMNDEPVHINNISVTCADHNHPNGATSYKISTDNFNIVYSTDSEHSQNNFNENVTSLAKNADILIHDSHFLNEDLLEHEGWGHSSEIQAANLAKKCNVKQLVLFHYSPSYNDSTIQTMEKNAKAVHATTLASKQGLIIEL